MADKNASGNNDGLYFLIGGLAVIVGIIAFVYFDGGVPSRTEHTDITIEAAPTTPPPAPSAQ